MTRRITDLRGADPYTLLEVSPEATTEDIQRAYRKVMRETHPDTATGDEDRTKLLNIARDVLVDPDLRAEYDRRGLGTQPPQPAPASAWEAEDIVVDDQPPVRPPSYPQVFPKPPAYAPPAYAPTQPVYPRAYPQPGYRPAPRSGIGLGVWALIAAVLCSPIGAVLGIVALMQKPGPEGADKVCAIIAVCWGGIALLCCLGYLAFGVLGSSLSTFSGT